MSPPPLGKSTQDETSEKPAWGAVFAMSLGVAGLVIAALLPVSLLTPMAAALGMTEGLAGQAVTATAAVAFVTSLLVAVANRRVDRRSVLLSLSVLLVVSNLLVAVAPNLLTLLLGRVLLGLALGGFWAMAAATVMRLVPKALVPRALSLLFGSGAVAAVVAAPLGCCLGGLLGWRGAFVVAAALGLLALVWKFRALPSMVPSGHARLSTLASVLKRPQVGLGMAAVVLVFMGHFAFFTYLRPFIENVTGGGVRGPCIILLGFGVATFVGASLAGPLLERNLLLMLTLPPLVMSVLAGALLAFGGDPLVTSVLVALWGLAFGAVPVGWSTWTARSLPDEAESGGGLLVAAVQLAISLGAAVGGAVFDRGGAVGVFTSSGIVLLMAALLVGIALVVPATGKHGPVAACGAAAPSPRPASAPPPRTPASRAPAPTPSPRR